MAIIVSQLPYPPKPSLERTNGTVINDVQVDKTLDTPSNPLLTNSCLRILVKSENSVETDAARALLIWATRFPGRGIA